MHLFKLNLSIFECRALEMRRDEFLTIPKTKQKCGKIDAKHFLTITIGNRSKVSECYEGRT